MSETNLGKALKEGTDLKEEITNLREQLTLRKELTKRLDPCANNLTLKSKTNKSVWFVITPSPSVTWWLFNPLLRDRARCCAFETNNVVLNIYSQPIFYQLS